ncbi:MAG: sulfotransferase family protein [Bacteroidota bacterium]|jgi:hypothetical protein
MSINRLKPSFLIIGAQKAGTSSLFNYLGQHPDITLRPNKELHFFDVQYDKGIEWYESLFPEGINYENQITGEASPYYLFHPLVPEYVRYHYPGIKLIILLRDPVDRAYSHFQMERKRGTEPLASFVHAVELEVERIYEEEQKILRGEIQSGTRFRNWSYMKRGLYGQQLQRWLGFFPREQFLIIRSEDFFSSTLLWMQQIHTFLGIRDIPPANLSPVNSNKYPELPVSVKDKLKDYFHDDGLLLQKLAGNNFVW